MEHLEQLEALGNLASAITETREILNTLDEPLTDEDLKQIEDLLDAMIVALESDCLEMFVDLFTQLHDTVVMYDNGIFAQFVAYSLQFKNPELNGRELTKNQKFHIEGAESILLVLVDEFIDEDEDEDFEDDDSIETAPALTTTESDTQESHVLVGEVSKAGE